MMNNKVLTAGVAVALVLGAVGLFVGGDTYTETGVTENQVRNIARDAALGAAVGPEHLNHQYFRSGYSYCGKDGDYATSSTAATYTLTTTELPTNRGRCYLSWTVNVNTTLTTMASSSAPLSNLQPGESYELLFYNASTTAGATATFAAGTGVDLQADEGGSVIVNGLELARLTFLKKADTDVILLVEPYQVGD